MGSFAETRIAVELTGLRTGDPAPVQRAALTVPGRPPGVKHPAGLSPGTLDGVSDPAAKGNLVYLPHVFPPD